MQRLVNATFAGRSTDSVRLDFESGWQCRIFVLADDLVRILFLRNETLKEPRTWMVAPGSVDVPWEGRDRLDVTGFSRPAFGITERDGEITLTTAKLSVAVTLQPFGVRWSTGEKVFAADRSTYSYQWSERSGVVRHSMARALTDRYFGLGDKTGPLDKHGRRLRTPAVDALGYSEQTSDPLYKHWPFMIGRDEASGVAYGVFYDTLAPTIFDPGCEYDNYHGFYRYTENDDGDLDYYLFVGPRIRDVVRAFTELTGRMAFGPRWGLCYATTAMRLISGPDTQARLA